MQKSHNQLVRNWMRTEVEREQTMKCRNLASLAVLLTGLAPPLSAQVQVPIPWGPNNPMPACNYLSSSGCEDKATFNTSSFNSPLGRWVYYSAQNSRILVNVQTANGWLWNPSKVAVDLANADPSGPTVALGVVLGITSPNPVYLRADIAQPPSAWQRYKRMMYLVYQGHTTNDGTAGRLCLSFSNSLDNANDWTPPIAAVFPDSGSPRGRPCNQANGEVLVEAASGFHRTPTEINLFALHGDLEILEAATTSNPNGGLTETYFLKTTVDTPDVIQVQGMVTSNGMVTTTLPGGDRDYFFRNLDVTYDPTNFRVYLMRATPFPYDVSRETDLPCAASAGPGGFGIHPMRGQIYYMDTQADVSRTTLPTSSWTLLADLGSGEGWGIGTGSTCVPYLATASHQQNINLDIDSISIHKIANGRIAKINGNLEFYIGGWDGMLSRPASYNLTKTLQLLAGRTEQQIDPGGAWRDAELWTMALPIPP
jgi:hypothetical protein